VTNHLVRSGALIEHACHAIFETAGYDKDEELEAVLTEPGFVRYRLLVADPTTTIAVAEWEALGEPGARRYGEWLRSSGIAQKLTLETYDGRSWRPPERSNFEE
jgi:hypothetical protein